MASIIKLPAEITNRIAAGEVVERPASIIKELLENSLDAGATNITIELEDGGCRLIKISDDGSGITAEELPLALARYATSKIKEFEDIYNIHSFGFRGEALASIASIARVEIISKVGSSLSASRIVVDNGKIIEQEPCGAPDGTTITVSGVFDALPARKKFLKSASTELGYSLEAITKVALAGQATRIRVKNNGKEVAFYPSCADIASRAVTVLGRAFAEKMLPVGIDTDEISIVGIASSPEKSVANSKSIYLFVNGRFVKDYLINHAIIGAYRRLIEPKRYPLALLFVSVKPDEVDVNVHPAKMEVRFRYPRAVYEAVSAAIAKTLAPISGTEIASAEADFTRSAEGQSAEYKKRVEDALRRYTASYVARPAPGFFISDSNRGFTYGAPLGFKNERTFVDAPSPSPLRGEGGEGGPTPLQGDWQYLGAIQETYLLFEDTGGLVIIDQHAAHERIIFEKLKADALASTAAVQEMIVPEIITLPTREARALDSLLGVFSQIGFLIEQFGTDTYIIKGIPSVLASASPRALVEDIVAEVMIVAGKPSIDELRERMLVRLACTNAVKAHHALAEKEVESLVANIRKLGAQLTCPHGRPILMRISLVELEKMFKRR